MRSLVLSLLLACGWAGATPLLGTKASFVESSFCKVYACRLVGKDALGAGLSEWRYVINGERGREPYAPPQVVSVLRQNDRIISAQWVAGAQDTVLYPGSYGTQMATLLIRTLTGKAPTAGGLFDLNDRCEVATPKPHTIAWGAYRLSCLLSAEFAGAWRFSLRVHLP
ncbi:hypothetical protein [Deinococcus aquaedulcis]|uniref:hypothetical protein n=1 Tax=Deinococcus aquaedulcis TaxID=2840455 RepID=UPI001C83CB61|nr:hypothetical protein [Deinococcus aquaedulcis]